jgi:predicted RNase H-like HicB family nuclease
MDELLFNVTQDSDGGYVAIAKGPSIATQGDTWDELCYMVLDAVKGYFEVEGTQPPDRIRLFLHVEQVLAVA